MAESFSFEEASKPTATGPKSFSFEEASTPDVSSNKQEEAPFLSRQFFEEGMVGRVGKGIGERAARFMLPESTRAAMDAQEKDELSKMGDEAKKGLGRLVSEPGKVASEVGANVRQMGRQMVEHPINTAVTMLKGIVQDPEFLLIGGLGAVAKTGAITQKLNAASQIAAKTLASGAEGAAVMGGAELAAQTAERKPYDPAALGTQATMGGVFGAGLHAGKEALGMARQTLQRPKAPGEAPAPSEAPGAATEPPTPPKTEASTRVDANLREAELATSASKKLKEAAFMDTETGEHIPQGSGHDEMLKSNPKLVQGFLTEDGSFVTRKEAQIIAENQHADLLTKKVDPKEGLHSTDFGPERMDALKPKEEIKSIEPNTREEYLTSIENIDKRMLELLGKTETKVEDLIALNNERQSLIDKTPDPEPISKATSERINEALNEWELVGQKNRSSEMSKITSTEDLVNYVQSTLGKEHFVSILLDKMKERMKGWKVEHISEKDWVNQGFKSSWSAASDPEKSRLVFKESVGHKIETAAHEVVHEGTQLELEVNPAFKSEIRSIMDAVKSDFKSATDKLLLNQGENGQMRPTTLVDKQKIKDLRYAFDSEAEFISMGTTSPTVIRLLKDIKYKGKETGFTKFVSAISEALGFSAKEKSAFQHLLEATERGMKSSPDAIPTATTTHTVKGLRTGAPESVTPEVDPTRYDPRKVTDEADLKAKGKELYASKGADAAREFFTGYEKYKETWANPVKEVEDFVEININNKMANERIVTNNSNDLKTLVPDAALREQVAIAIDAKKTDTLTGAAKEAADKYNGLMKDVGERALKEGVVKGLLENYVTHIVNWADMPKGALETFLGETFGTGSSRGEPGKGMSPESRFGKERKVETFAQLDRVLADINDRIALAGKDFKLEVKTKDIAEIYKEYALSMEKAIENKKLVDSVTSIRNPNGESMVRRVTAEEPLPFGWEMIKDRQFAGYAVHPDLAPALKFAFEAKGNAVVNALYTVSQATKRLNVIGSFFHAKSLMEVLSSTGIPIVTPIKEVALGLVDKALGTQYSGIRKAVEQFKAGGLGDSVDKWQRDGLVLEMPSDVTKGLLGSTGKFADSLIGKFGPKTRILESTLSATEKYTLGVFDKITWDYLHTGGKLYVADKYFEKARLDAAKQGKPFDEAASRKEIVSFVNKSFGGLNWFQEARSAQTEFGKRMAIAAYSPQGRKALQIMLFAPDWTISTIKAFTSALPKELNPTKWHPVEGIKGMATPSTKADYARLYQFKTALTYLTLLNGINMLTANRPIWENKDPTRIEWPDGTSMQAMKHAMEPYHWISDPDKTLANKLGFIPKAAVIAATGLEYASPTAPKLVDPSIVNRAKAIASMALPFQASAGLSAPEGEGGKRALLGTLGFPVYGKTKAERKASNSERAKQLREARKRYKEKAREKGWE